MHFSNSCTFQIHALFKFMHFFKFIHFSNSCTFQIHALFNFMHFSKFSRIKNYVLFAEFRAFSKLPCFKNSPFKVHFRIPQKTSVFFRDFPVQKTIDFTNSVFFIKKFRVLQNSPVFRFLNL